MWAVTPYGMVIGSGPLQRHAENLHLGECLSFNEKAPCLLLGAGFWNFLQQNSIWNIPLFVIKIFSNTIPRSHEVQMS